MDSGQHEARLGNCVSPVKRPISSSRWSERTVNEEQIADYEEMMKGKVEGPPAVRRRELLKYGASLAAVSALRGTDRFDLARIERSLPLRPATASKPNIVFILMDNLGYGEPGCYGGGEVRGAPTPRIDKLASEGTRLTNFNVEAQCTPSRSAIMTGRFAIRSGTHSVPLPGTPDGLTQWETTIAEVLSGAGYATAHFGKWHLGSAQGRLPTDQGFDEWFCIPRTTTSSRPRSACAWPWRNSRCNRAVVNSPCRWCLFTVGAIALRTARDSNRRTVRIDRFHSLPATACIQ